MTSLFDPLTLPCGAVIKNRIAKAAMSDSLGDGRGNPTPEQARLYERWALGGAGLSIIGEVQGDPNFAEKPGNLVLGLQSDLAAVRNLTDKGTLDGTHLWAQLGHAGAMAHPPIGTPKGPSALDLPGLTCGALSPEEIQGLPATFAAAADLAKRVGFTGVEVHAAHGFLLSQFLSPLFNKREDAYGGSAANRRRLLLEVLDAVRNAVGPDFPIGLKLNATDQLDGGLAEDQAMEVVAALDNSSIDLLDISGGTYFPGAKSTADNSGGEPYFLAFAARARAKLTAPVMTLGGFKTSEQARRAVSEGATDIVGLARALVLAPDLPRAWQAGQWKDPVFPRFSSRPEGGVTAWYTLEIRRLAEGLPGTTMMDLEEALADYLDRDVARESAWREAFPASRPFS